MAQHSKPADLLILQELSASNGYEIAALVAVVREWTSHAGGGAESDQAIECANGEGPLETPRAPRKRSTLKGACAPTRVRGTGTRARAGGSR